MTITEAEKRCMELSRQIINIEKDYDFGGWAKHCGKIKAKPLINELDKLQLAVIKAKNVTEVINENKHRPEEVPASR